MRAFLLVLVVVLASIGVGVAIESSGAASQQAAALPIRPKRYEIDGHDFVAAFPSRPKISGFPYRCGCRSATVYVSNTADAALLVATAVYARAPGGSGTLSFDAGVTKADPLLALSNAEGIPMVTPYETVIPAGEGLALPPERYFHCGHAVGGLSICAGELAHDAIPRTANARDWWALAVATTRYETERLLASVKLPAGTRDPSIHIRASRWTIVDANS